MLSSPFSAQTASQNNIRVKRSYQKMLQHGKTQFTEQEYHCKKYKLLSKKIEQEDEMISKKGVYALNAVSNRTKKTIPERIKTEIEKYNSEIRILGINKTYCDCPNTYDYL